MTHATALLPSIAIGYGNHVTLGDCRGPLPNHKHTIVPDIVPSYRGMADEELNWTKLGRAHIYSTKNKPFGNK